MMPQPAIDVWNKPFWDACSEKRLMVQLCQTTKKTWFPPSPVSPYNPKGSWNWVQSTGEGAVLSWVVFHQKYFAGFAERIPYNVAMVRLDEGFDLVTNIDAPNDEIAIGRRVSLRFERRGDVNVPIFVWANANEQ